MSTLTSHPRSLYARFQHLIHELGKFGVVGGVAFVVDFGIYYVLLHRGMEPTLAKTISLVIAATLAFIGNRFWTWRDRTSTALHREYVIYFVLNLIGLGITVLVLRFSHYVMGAEWPFFKTKTADLISGMFVGNALATIFRFWSYRRFVFLAPRSDEA